MSAVIEHAPARELEKADVVYPLAVLEGAGWEWPGIERAVRQVEEIFGQCGVAVTVGHIYLLSAPDDFLELDESMQSRLLDRLPESRPAALLVGRTTDQDTAYSYLVSAPVPSRGTAWVTRASRPVCLGVLLAHELGHILLNTARHNRDPENLMSYTCTISNIQRSAIGARLSASQCRQLRER
ncbi:MAG: hypothetical protein U5R46_03755 [Gammaproteobacteria bacterium]|nr:hypothetical protein [Gammaproteobacteria bacterium]